MHSFLPDDPDAARQLRQFAAANLNCAGEQVIRFVWLSLPDDRRNLIELKRAIGELVERLYPTMQDELRRFDEFGR